MKTKMRPLQVEDEDDPDARDQTDDDDDEEGEDEDEEQRNTEEIKLHVSNRRPEKIHLWETVTTKGLKQFLICHCCLNFSLASFTCSPQIFHHFFSLCLCAQYIDLFFCHQIVMVLAVLHLFSSFSLLQNKDQAHLEILKYIEMQQKNSSKPIQYIHHSVIILLESFF